MIESGDVAIVLQMMSKPHPDLPKVPLAINFARADEARQLIQVGIYDINVITRPYVLPPGTPKDRVDVLRKAFADTMRDPELSLSVKSVTQSFLPTPKSPGWISIL